MQKLKNTESEAAFKYGYLLKKMYPYIKTVLWRSVLLIIIAMPLGLLEGAVALALKPYMDYVVNGNSALTINLFGHTYVLQEFCLKLIPVAIIAFAVLQGAGRGGRGAARPTSRCASGSAGACLFLWRRGWQWRARRRGCRAGLRSRARR